MRRLMVRTIIVAMAMAVVWGPGANLVEAQDRNDEITGKFEIASVRQSKNGDGESIQWSGGGRFRAANMTLYNLIVFSYEITNLENLKGGPSWIRTTRFDVDASFGDRPESRREVQLAALRHLLRERFHLSLRQLPVDRAAYGLIAAKESRPTPGLRRSAISCGTSTAVPAQTGSAAVNAQCSLSLDRQKGVLNAKGIQIAELSRLLTAIVGRPVRDQTGLSDSYDLNLTWSPIASGLTATTDTAVSDSRASIFTAIEEQLGLRLVGIRVPANAFEIVGAEPPSSN